MVDFFFGSLSYAVSYTELHGGRSFFGSLSYTVSYTDLHSG